MEACSANQYGTDEGRVGGSRSSRPGKPVGQI